MISVNNFNDQWYFFCTTTILFLSRLINNKMNIPKNTSLIVLLIIFVISSCSDTEYGDKSLKDKKKSEEIMSSISADSAMTEEMLNHLILNKRANLQVKSMMKSIITKDFLMDLMAKDSILTNEVLCSVMELSEKNQMVCRQMEQTMERYDLKEKLGFELDTTLVEKDKVEVKKYIKVPVENTSSGKR